jgi:hypothetical protein
VMAWVPALFFANQRWLCLYYTCFSTLWMPVCRLGLYELVLCVLIVQIFFHLSTLVNELQGVRAVQFKTSFHRRIKLFTSLHAGLVQSNS